MKKLIITGAFIIGFAAFTSAQTATGKTTTVKSTTLQKESKVGANATQTPALRNQQQATGISSGIKKEQGPAVPASRQQITNPNALNSKKTTK